MNKHPNDYTIMPKIGTFLNDFLEAKAGFKLASMIGTSSQDEWLLTYVERYFGYRVEFL